MAHTHTHIQSRMAGMAVMDLACLIFGALVGVRVRIGPAEWLDYARAHPERWLLLFGAVILANYLTGGYRIQSAYSRFNLVVTWLFSLLFAVLLLSLTSYAWLKMAPGRGVLALTLAAYSALALTLKLLVYQRLFRSESFVCRTVIMGTGPRAREMRRIVESNAVLPLHRVVGFLRPVRRGAEEDRAVAAGSRQSGEALDGLPIKECADANVRAEALRFSPHLLIVGLDDLRDVRQCYPELKRLRFEGVEVLTPLKVAETYVGRIPLDQIDEEYLMHASMESGLPAIRRIKRVFDLTVSCLGLTILAVPMALLALAIKLTDPSGPVLYVQERVGLFGARFRMIKFRTMRQGAESDTGPVWSAPDDERVTTLGRALRRFRLDELPQLLNVLRGDMSLVGPRPERREMTEQLDREIPYFSERLNVMPGLTGWAQIRYPYGNSVADARRKLEYDLYYIKNLSASLDLQILLSTLRVAALGKERTL